jgi:hypothetical protein
VLLRTAVRLPNQGGPVMADDVKTVTAAPGTALYTGAGLHPFRPGAAASVQADLPMNW